MKTCLYFVAVYIFFRQLQIILSVCQFLLLKIKSRQECRLRQMFSLFTPKVSVIISTTINIDLGESQASATKKKSKQNLILVIESKHTTSAWSTSQPFLLPTKTNPRTIKVKAHKKTTL